MISKMYRSFVKELPFLLFAFIMIGGVSALRRIHGEMITLDPKVSLLNLLGQLLVAFFFAYTLTIIFTASAKKWLKIIGYVFLFLWYFVVSFVDENFDSRISPQVLTLLAETTSTESSEFLQVYAFAPTSLAVYGRIIILVFLVLLTEYLYKKFRLGNLGKKLSASWINGLSKVVAIFLLAVLALSAICCGKYYFELFRCSTSDEVSTWQPLGPQDSVTDVVYSLYALNLADKEVSTAIEVNKNAVEELSVMDGDSINLIVVIGESHIKWHSSIYGYKFLTNPFMENERDSGRLFVFEDVAASYIRTSDNIKNILSCNSIGQKEKWYERPIFPVIFKKVGYHVSFFDNQGNGSTTSTGFALNSFLYNADILNISYDQVSDTCFSYDGQMVEHYAKIGTRGKRNLLIFHLLGQHVKAEDNYPHTSQFNKFKAKDIDRYDAWLDDVKRQTIADYDNATLYNDYVLKEITKLFEDENTIMIYMSDHGEETYDFRDQYGRKLHDKMTSNYVKYIYEIPFLIWCSNKFVTAHPDVVSQLKEATKKPFSSDNTSQILFYLGRVRDYYISERNPLTDEYKCPQRFVEGEYLFDECRKPDNK